MKKKISLALTLVLCLSLLASCGSKAASTTPPASPANTKDVPLHEQAAGKTYVIGTDTTFAPFEFEDETGKHTGIDILLYEAIADEMGFTIQWQILGFSASVAALEAGQVDGVMAGMSITEERQKKYDFSKPYYESATAIAVAADSSFSSLDDLRGQTVVAKTGTTGAQYAETLVDEYDLNLLYVEESSLMYTYVSSGQAVACFEDYPVVQYEIARGNVNCKVIHTSESTIPYGMATMKGKHPELVAAFNEGLSRLQQDGTYDEILSTFFG